MPSPGSIAKEAEGDPEVTDYVLVRDAYAENDGKSSRPVVKFDHPCHIYGDVWISRIDHALSGAILDACQPRGENWKPENKVGCSYAFYRLNALKPGGRVFEFDEDCALYTCVAISRLVHPTAVGFRYAARVLEVDGGDRTIIPATQLLLNASAYVADTNENWLIPDDIPPLAGLLKARDDGPLPPRPAKALWHHEAAARQHFIELRWPLVTTALEALVKIKDEKLPNGKKRAGSTQVFVRRLRVLGDLDPALSVPESKLRAMYEERSLLVHGMEFGKLDEQRKNLYRSQERLLREIIRKGLLDPAFRDIFVSDASVKKNLPLRK